MLGVCGQRSFSSQGIVIRHAILGTNMLKDLLVDVKLSAGVG